MITFEELYQRLLRASLENRTAEAIAALPSQEYDPRQLDCLLHPEKHPPVYKISECDCSLEDRAKCLKQCPFDALFEENQDVCIDPERCQGCSACVSHCQKEKIKASRDILPALEAIKKAQGPVYALIAPAFLGQFSPSVTPGKLRSAFKALNFDGMVECALFADILTLKEALEFDKKILNEKDFQLTSCCCPMWVAMIRKVYHELVPNLPGSVSPMIASGRTIKHIHPDAITIFVGPCLAKKAEAREKDIADAVDYVLTFQEIQDVFAASQIDPDKMPESERDNSSRAGRIYARTGGVSEAVADTVQRLNPQRKIHVKTKQADGVAACKTMLNDILSNKINANFFEGMGCPGGCVGGPKSIIDREEGKKNVDQYGNAAIYPTPLDNPYVIELLHRLGFNTVESLLADSKIFTRHFS